MGFESREPVRIFEPLNGWEIKKMLLQKVQKVLDGDGSLVQGICYPIFGCKITFEFFTGGGPQFDKRDWKDEGEQVWKQQGVEVEPGEVKKHEELWIVDGVETPPDMAREQQGMPLPNPVRSSTGYVQGERPVPTATTSVSDELSDWFNQEGQPFREPVATAPQEKPAKDHILKGTVGKKGGMTLEERQKKVKEYQDR